MPSTDTVRVCVLRTHAFRGITRHVGELYDVDGDQSQTAAQYFNTLRITGCAKAADPAPTPVGRKRKT